MATKKQPVAKKAAKTKPTTSTRSSGAKKTKRISASMLYKERNPENHHVSGKYKFFYITFACTTIFFAALSVWLFVFASETQNKYESIESCARAHTRCHVSYGEEGAMNVEGEE